MNNKRNYYSTCHFCSCLRLCELYKKADINGDGDAVITMNIEASRGNESVFFERCISAPTSRL